MNSKTAPASPPAEAPKFGDEPGNKIVRMVANHILPKLKIIIPIQLRINTINNAPNKVRRPMINHFLALFLLPFQISIFLKEHVYIHH